MRAYLNTISNPWRVFDEWVNELPYELLNNVWHTRAAQYPRVNVWEREDGLRVEAEVAGVNPDKLDVAVDANVLTIKGEKEQEDGSKTEFQRSFNLPFELESENIKASVKNGMLTVSIPRKASEKRMIAIEKL